MNPLHIRLQGIQLVNFPFREVMLENLLHAPIIVAAIFQYLDYPDLLALSVVSLFSESQNKYWRLICHSEELWAIFYFTRYGLITEPNLDYRLSCGASWYHKTPTFIYKKHQTDSSAPSKPFTPPQRVLRKRETAQAAESLPPKRLKLEATGQDLPASRPGTSPPRTPPPAQPAPTPMESPAPAQVAQPPASAVPEACAAPAATGGAPAPVRITLHLAPGGEANADDFMVSQIPGEFERVRKRTRQLLGRALSVSPDGRVCRRLETAFHQQFPTYYEYTTFLPFFRMVLFQHHEKSDFKALQAGKLSANEFMTSVFNPTGLQPL